MSYTTFFIIQEPVEKHLTIKGDKTPTSYHNYLKPSRSHNKQGHFLPTIYFHIFNIPILIQTYDTNNEQNYQTNTQYYYLRCQKHATEMTDQLRQEANRTGMTVNEV